MQQSPTKRGDTVQKCVNLESDALDLPIQREQFGRARAKNQPFTSFEGRL
jgi:hypothetical protein